MALAVVSYFIFVQYGARVHQPLLLGGVFLVTRPLEQAFAVVQLRRLRWTHAGHYFRTFVGGIAARPRTRAF